MSVQWTEDQKKVIELRNRNILVSAAAGSAAASLAASVVFGASAVPAGACFCPHPAIDTTHAAAKITVTIRPNFISSPPCYEHSVSVSQTLTCGF